MLTRPAEDVWLELTARARRLLQTSTPVLTLEREIPNWITTVEAAVIRRRSAMARGVEEDSAVAAREVVAVWRELQEHGRTSGTDAVLFAYALLGRLVDGVVYEPNPFRLRVDDEAAANQLWQQPPFQGAQPSRARDDLLGAIDRLRVYRDGEATAPHKPLLLLLTLAGYATGTARRTALFSELEPRLSGLIARFSDLSAEVEPQEPFWRLKSSGIWLVEDAGGKDFDASGPPGLRYLRDQKVRAGFVAPVDRALWVDDALASDAIAALLSHHFPPEQHPALLEAVGLQPTHIAKESPIADDDEDLRAALRAALAVLAGTDQSAERWPALREAIERSGSAALKKLVPSGYSVKGSTGIGNAATVPWLATFPPGAASSAKTGIYVVYLFAADGSVVYLSLNQAGSQISGGVQALHKRALDLRTVVGQQPDLLEDIDLATTGQLGRRYAAGNAYAIAYRLADLDGGVPVGADLTRILGLLERVSAAGVSFDAELEPLHLLFKWSADREPRTVERHRTVAERAGSVWWGKFAAPGSTGMGASKLADLQAQLLAGVLTHAYVYRQDEVWKTRLLELTTNAADVDSERMAGYYGPDECNLFARLSDFEQVPSSDFRSSVLLASNPDPTVLGGALGNQQNPLFLYERWLPAGPISPPPAAALTLEWLSEKTLWPVDRLTELVASLTDASPQVVLAGPPGTGKTWVADLVARYLTNDAPLQHRTVQFHPSYGYEEFVEGLRPVLSEHKTLAFDRVDGTVLQMAAAAAKSDQPHVLIIDEMNRANIPRVFGELMYLLEYRNKPLTLTYTENFELPANLHFIGTMNTADRSIRSIDVALRRRFDIFDCPPDADILRGFYAKAGNSTTVTDLIEGFIALNRALTEDIDRHHTVGHTFFMSKEFDAAALRRTWLHQLAPLIEDYFFDRPDIVGSYTLGRFWPSVGN